LRGEVRTRTRFNETALFQSPEISICRIEILNCTFYPKPLYQRYIRVVVRAILKTSRWSFVFGRWPNPIGLEDVCTWFVLKPFIDSKGQRRATDDQRRFSPKETF